MKKKPVTYKQFRKNMDMLKAAEDNKELKNSGLPFRVSAKDLTQLAIPFPEEVEKQKVDGYYEPEYYLGPDYYTTFPDY